MHAKRMRKAVLAVIALAAAAAGVLSPASGPAGATGSNTITTPASSSTEGPLGVSLALDASGNPVVSYLDYVHGGNSSLKVLHCNDLNCAGGDDQASITDPETTGQDASGPSLALDAGGNPVVSYTVNRSTGRGTTAIFLTVLHCNDPNCAGGDESITAPDRGANGTLALNASGNPVVSYVDTTGSLKVLHCNDPNCDRTVNGPESATSPDPAVPAGVSAESLVLDASGNPIISYFDSSNGGLKVLHCGNPACTSGNIITTLDSGVFPRSSLAVDTSGNPVVSYFGSHGMMLLRCGNPTCTSGNSIVAPLPGGDAGLSAHLALDASGNPVMSYAAQFNHDPRVLHCGNPTCTSGNTVAAPDPTALTDHDMSLALDARGNPVVGYSHLQVLHCGDPTCFAAKLPAPLPQYSGDADCSQVVTAIDALLVLQFSAGLLSSLPCQSLADVYVDINSDSRDAAIILQYVAGLIPFLPVCTWVCWFF